MLSRNIEGNGFDELGSLVMRYCAELCRFKRLTGRDEVAVSAGDYKFYAPRHKYRRVSSSSSVSNVHGLPVSLTYLLKYSLQTTVDNFIQAEYSSLICFSVLSQYRFCFSNDYFSRLSLYH